MRIRMSWGKGEVMGALDDTETARRVYASLPCSAVANTWGKEVYFELPVKAKLEPDARDVVDAGTICFWVEGSSLALPFGPTPVSHGNECRLVTAVNVLGKLEGNPACLGTIRDGDTIELDKVE